VTKTMKASDARQQFSDVLNRVYRDHTRVLVERSGIPIAAIVSTEDLAILNQLDAERAERFAGLSRISEAFADVPADELEREVERAIAEGRAKARRELAKTAAAS
jgi:prevent-host-death family protein